MSSPGPTEPPEDPGEGVPLLLLLLALVVVVLALIIGVQVFRVVAGLIAPADAPLPAQVTEIEHENLAYGTDQWRYTTPLNPCEVVAFYEEEGSTCTVREGLCEDTQYISPSFSVERAASCTGLGSFSVFGVRWDVVIGTTYSGGEDATYFDLLRETLWSGPPPPATSTPPPAR
jgi:hypothetical protein